MYWRYGKIDFKTLSSAERYVFRKQAISLKKSGIKGKVIAEMFGVRKAVKELLERELGI